MLFYNILFIFIPIRSLPITSLPRRSLEFLPSRNALCSPPEAASLASLGLLMSRTRRPSRPANRNPKAESVSQSSIFQTFLERSSIHGLGHIETNGRWAGVGRVITLCRESRILLLFRSAWYLGSTLWSIIVLIGFLLTFCLTFMVWKDWHQNPVSTSVVQIPIENILFPSVTLCPRGE